MAATDTDREGHVVVSRRHVFYIEGYDPQGAPGYYRLFRGQLARFAALWGLETRLSKLESDADGIASRWQCETAGPNWKVATTYEVLRWDDLIARDMKRPTWQLFALGLVAFLANILSGVVFRLFAFNWRFATFFVVVNLVWILVLVLPFVLAIAGFRFASGSWLLPAPAAALFAVAVLGVTFALALKLARSGYFVQLISAGDWMWSWSRGQHADFDQRIEEFARRIVERARFCDADEIVIVGHSVGAAIVVPLAALALDIDSAFADRGPRVSVLALGTPLPALALQPHADRIHAAIRRLAREPSLSWIEVRSHKDVMCCHGFDLVKDLAIDAGASPPNPVAWPVRFRDMLAPQDYRWQRINFFRMHFQYIMANDRRATYDYFMLICGPAPVAAWVGNREATFAAFGADASYRDARPDAAMPA